MIFLFLIIGLIPLLSSIDNFGYEQIKVIVFFVLTSVSAILLLFESKKLEEIKLTKLDKVLICFTLILFAGSIFGIDPRVSFLGVFPYFQGWVVYSYLLLFYFLIKLNKIDINEVAFTLTVSAFLVSAVGISQWIELNILGVSVLNYAGRVISTFGQPNFFAGFILMCLPFTFYLFKNEKSRGKLIILLIMLTMALAIFLSGSRAALFLLLGLSIIPIASKFINLKILGVLCVLAIILVGGVSFYTKTGFIWEEFIDPLTNINPDLTQVSIEKRVYLWPQALNVFLERSILGYGPENIPTAFSSYYQKNKHPLFEENLNISPVLISFKELTIDRSHNYILDLLLFSGAGGALIWLILIFMLIKKAKNKYILAGLLTYIIWVQFQNQSIVNLIYFYLLAGLIKQKQVV